MLATRHPRRHRGHQQDAVDKLWEIATAHALVRALGENRVQRIIAEAFGAIEDKPISKKVAA